MRCAVKYCGGCNPRFDRRQLALRLEAALGMPFESLRAGEHYDVLYVICGCTARCADVSAYRADRIVLLDGPELPPLA